MRRLGREVRGAGSPACPGEAAGSVTAAARAPGSGFRVVNTPALPADVASLFSLFSQGRLHRPQVP